MTAQELFDALFAQYNAQNWHMVDEHKCFNLKCPDMPPQKDPEGYAEVKEDIVFSKTSLVKRLFIKKGTTIRFTHASNMGCLDGTFDLDRSFGYDFRLMPDVWSKLENCRLTRDQELKGEKKK